MVSNPKVNIHFIKNSPFVNIDFLDKSRKPEMSRNGDYCGIYDEDGGNVWGKKKVKLERHRCKKKFIEGVKKQFRFKHQISRSTI